MTLLNNIFTDGIPDSFGHIPWPGGNRANLLVTKCENLCNNTFIIYLQME